MVYTSRGLNSENSGRRYSRIILHGCSRIFTFIIYGFLSLMLKQTIGSPLHSVFVRFDYFCQSTKIVPCLTTCHTPSFFIKYGFPKLKSCEKIYALVNLVRWQYGGNQGSCAFMMHNVTRPTYLPMPVLAEFFP